MRSLTLFHRLAGFTLAAVLALSAVSALAHEKTADADGVASTVPLPVHHINTDKGDKCVRSDEIMRRDHMKFILHQRDNTVHDGIRTSQYSLKNCVDCHADKKTGSVLGSDGFCESCHRYAAVKLDCFECHSSQRETAAAAPAPSAVRALTISQQKNANPARGKKP